MDHSTYEWPPYENPSKSVWPYSEHIQTDEAEDRVFYNIYINEICFKLKYHKVKLNNVQEFRPKFLMSKEYNFGLIKKCNKFIVITFLRK